MNGTDALLAGWRDDLASWAIPREILEQAPAAPWATERAVFIQRAADRKRSPRGNSYRRAAEALPSGGALLDVGAGAGAASLPLLERASLLVAVDQDAELLRALKVEAGTDRSKVRTILGSWPEVAASAPVVNVVVCHHVLYNVAELGPFITALEGHARRRVVIEITAQHPVAWLNPLWERFHGLARPSWPTGEQAVAAIEGLRGPVNVERERLAPQGDAAAWSELVARAGRRLCLAPERAAEVAAALEAEGARPGDPASWPAANQDVITIWWDL